MVVWEDPFQQKSYMRNTISIDKKKKKRKTRGTLNITPRTLIKSWQVGSAREDKILHTLTFFSSPLREGPYNRSCHASRSHEGRNPATTSATLAIPWQPGLTNCGFSPHIPLKYCSPATCPLHPSVQWWPAMHEPRADTPVARASPQRQPICRMSHHLSRVSSTLTRV